MDYHASKECSCESIQTTIRDGEAEERGREKSHQETRKRKRLSWFGNISIPYFPEAEDSRGRYMKYLRRIVIFTRFLIAEVVDIRALSVLCSEAYRNQKALKEAYGAMAIVGGTKNNINCFTVVDTAGKHQKILLSGAWRTSIHLR